MNNQNEALGPEVKMLKLCASAVFFFAHFAFQVKQKIIIFIILDIKNLTFNHNAYEFRLKLLNEKKIDLIFVTNSNN